MRLGGQSPGTLGSALVTVSFAGISPTAELEPEQRFDEGTNRFAFELRWHLKCPFVALDFRLWYLISTASMPMLLQQKGMNFFRRRKLPATHKKSRIIRQLDINPAWIIMTTSH